MDCRGSLVDFPPWSEVSREMKRQYRGVSPNHRLLGLIGRIRNGAKCGNDYDGCRERQAID